MFVTEEIHRIDKRENLLDENTLENMLITCYLQKIHSILIHFQINVEKLISMFYICTPI